MADRMLTIGDYVTLNDVRRVVETAKQMDEDEELIVSLNSQEAARAANIFTVLERNHFHCATKGGHDGREYYIIVRRKHE